jgi:hypothetical protein
MATKPRACLWYLAVFTITPVLPADDRVIQNSYRLDFVSIATGHDCEFGKQPANRDTIAVVGAPDKNTPDKKYDRR